MITEHLLHHLVDGVRRFRPVHFTWMFSYEHFNSLLHRRIMIQCHPEAILMETYNVNIVLNSCIKYNLAHCFYFNI